MIDIINDYIELKIEELVGLKFDKDYPEHGKGRLYLVTQSIEKDLINFDYNTQISILDKLSVQIMQHEIKLFHYSKFDLFDTDITDDLLKWIDKQAVLWELKMTLKSQNHANMKPDVKPDFADYLKHPEPEKLISELKKIFPEAIGKKAALMFTALIENDIAEKPTNNIDITRAIKKEWSLDFSDESFNRPFRKFESDKKTGYKGEVIAAINKVKQIVVI